MPFDAGGLEILGDDECLALLQTTPVGRIVFTHQALPAVQPVNYALDGQDVIIRTSPGSKRAAAAATSARRPSRGPSPTSSRRAARRSCEPGCSPATGPPGPRT